MGSGGNGTSQHLSGEMFKMMAGIDIVHVPYRGAAPALTDLVGGQVQAMFGEMPPSLEFIRAGKLRALGVTTAARSQALPDVPTVAGSSCRATGRAPRRPRRQGRGAIVES